MVKYIDNSITKNIITGMKLLVIVPHEDDEVILAGNAILWFKWLGGEVFVCFATNGDYKCNADIRIREAQKSCHVLGVNKENIYFLGYGDSLNGSGNVFNAGEKKYCVSRAGKTETYGSASADDFAVSYLGMHHLYTRENFCMDLTEIINRLLPDYIISVDYDNHPDHRILSICLDICLADILKKDILYRPILFKRFAYSLAYFANKDYSGINLEKTLYPSDRNYKSGEKRIIGNSLYRWEERIRIPYFFDGKVRKLISSQKIYKALKKHISQYAALRADRIINSDEIYWIKRTDNLMWEGEVLSSSGECKFLSDFLYYNTKSVDEIETVFEEYLWEPDSDDFNPYIVVSWKTKKQIKVINIYGPIDGDLSLEKVEVLIDDVNISNQIKIEKRCSSYYILTFYKAVEVYRCAIKFHVKDLRALKVSELGIYSSRLQLMNLPPFIKVLAHDNVVYRLFLLNSEKQIPLSVVKFNIEAEQVIFKVIKGRGEIIDNSILNINAKRGHIIVKAEVKNSALYDQIDIVICSKLTMNVLKFQEYIGDILVHKDRIAFHIVNYLKKLT